MPPKRALIQTGDAVYARWPGTSLYYEGVVKDFNDIEYLVRFEDEDNSELAIKHANVMLANRFRSRSRSRGRSPGRKSPARSPARRKSAGRKPKPVTPNTSLEKEEPKSETKSPTLNSNDLNEAKKEAKRLLAPVSKAVIDAKEETPVRQSARIASMVEKREETTSSITSTVVANNIEKTNHVSTSPTAGCRVASMFCSVGGSVASFFCSVGSSVAAILSWVWLWVGPTLTSLPCLVIPLVFTYILHQLCNKKSVPLNKLPAMPHRVVDYYSPQALLILASSLFFTVLVSFIPLRGTVLLNGAKHRANGFVCLVLSGGVLFLLHHYEQFKITQFFTLLRPSLVAHMALAVIIGLVLYISAGYGGRRSQVNPKATGNFLPDLLVGRELQPRAGSLDLKTLLRRYAHVLTVVMVAEQLHSSKTLAFETHTALIAVAACQIWFAVDQLVFEGCYLSSFEYQQEGFGLSQACWYLSQPFLALVTTRQIAAHSPTHGTYQLAGLVALHMFGYLLYRLPEWQKSVYRANPSAPACSHLESVPTSAGPKLIVSSYWGLVRHPNDLGTILRHLAVALLAGVTIPWAWAVFAVHLLTVLYRLYKKEKHCESKYGISWQNYATRVKSKLIPKIF